MKRLILSILSVGLLTISGLSYSLDNLSPTQKPIWKQTKEGTYVQVKKTNKHKVNKKPKPITQRKSV
jgi:hypothetical protein